MADRYEDERFTFEPCDCGECYATRETRDRFEGLGLDEIHALLRSGPDIPPIADVEVKEGLL